MGWRALRKRRRAFILVTCLSMAIPTFLQAETLAEALANAYTSSGLLEQNRALLRAADEDAATAVAALRPIIDFGAALSRNLNESRPDVTSRNANLTATWVLWNGARARLSAQAARETVLATRAALLSLEQRVLFRAVQAYMDVIRDTEFVALRENNVQLLEQELRAAGDRFDVGEVTRTDVALAEARLAQARSNLATSQGNLTNTQQEFLAATGQLPTDLTAPPRLPERPASVEIGQAFAIRNHPDVMQVQHQLASAELVVQAARAELGPSLSFQGRLDSADTDGSLTDGESASLAINLRQRIYQGGALTSRLRSTMASRDSVRAGLLVTQKNIRQDVAAAMVRVEVAEANISASEGQVQAAEVAFRGVREEARLGARTTLDVLDAEQELLNAQANLIAAQSELNVAAYQILQSQGALTAENLGLNVQIYDPADYYEKVKNAPALISARGRQLDRVLRKLDEE